LAGGEPIENKNRKEDQDDAEGEGGNEAVLDHEIITEAAPDEKHIFQNAGVDLIIHHVLREEKEEKRTKVEKSLEAKGEGVLDPEIGQEEEEPGDDKAVHLGREKLLPGDKKS